MSRQHLKQFSSGFQIGLIFFVPFMVLDLLIWAFYALFPPHN